MFGQETGIHNPRFHTREKLIFYQLFIQVVGVAYKRNEVYTRRQAGYRNPYRLDLFTLIEYTDVGKYTLS